MEEKQGNPQHTSFTTRANTSINPTKQHYHHTSPQVHINQISKYLPKPTQYSEKKNQQA
jgi:hypothetical protein